MITELNVHVSKAYLILVLRHLSNLSISARIAPALRYLLCLFTITLKQYSYVFNVLMP